MFGDYQPVPHEHRAFGWGRGGEGGGGGGGGAGGGGIRTSLIRHKLIFSFASHPLLCLLNATPAQRRRPLAVEIGEL